MVTGDEMNDIYYQTESEEKESSVRQVISAVCGVVANILGYVAVFLIGALIGGGIILFLNG